MTVDPDKSQDVEDDESGSRDLVWPFLFIASILVIVAAGVIIDSASTTASDGDVIGETTTTTGDGEATTTTSPPEGGGDVVVGEVLFASTCTACHGPDAMGIENLGKKLADSEFVRSMTDEELVRFIQVGRPADDPDNMTGVAMPPQGGNPALSDDDLLDIVTYLRTLN